MGQKLGQHFLKDLGVARFIANSAELNKNETVLEVGPGKGIITKMLAKRCKKVIAVEKDKMLRPYLDNLPDNVEVIYEDILKMTFPKTDKIVSNLPFYISSQFIFKLPPVLTILGLQKEFAEKMSAKAGSHTYGRLSVSSQIKFHIKLLKNFPPSVFSPPPKVWTTVIQLKPNNYEEWEKCEDFIRRVFPYPNKTVDNALKLGGYIPIGMDKRTRDLTPEEVIKLTKTIQTS